MRLWTDRILPRLIDRELRTPEVNARRSTICAGLHGTVLEIGFGTGPNLAQLPPEVDRVLAVEPSDTAWRLAQPRIAAWGQSVVRTGLDGSRLDQPDDSVDAVLSTYTLCTIPDLAAALGEVRRVLKPGGRLHFLEHGLAPDPDVRRWQHRLDALQGRVAGGCHLNRTIDTLITGAGLDLVSLDTGYGEGPRVASYLSWGTATA